MRDSLTFLAILLIGLLTVALVAPYFVDWTAHRAWLESKLSQAAGVRIAIAGPIRIRLLPQPIFRFKQVTIGEAGAGQQSLTAAELDVDVNLTALFRGDLDVGEAVLRSPRLDLVMEPSGTLNLRLPMLGDARRVQVQHVVVVDGTVTLVRPGRSPLTLSNLDIDGEATSLAGPFKATGRFGPGGDPQSFRLSTGALEHGKVHLKLAFEAAQGRPSVEFDGIAAASGARGPVFDGIATLKGSVPLDANPATIPWTLATHVQADQDKATLTDVDLRAGADLRALGATGAGDLVLGAAPRATLRLQAPLLDLDRLAVAREGSTVAPPKGVALLSGLNRRLTKGRATPLPFGLDLAFGVDTATTAAMTVLGLNGEVGLDGSGAARLRLTANGPDLANVTLDGRVETGAAPAFQGRLTSNVRDLPRFADWLSPVLPDVAAWLRRTIGARAVGFDGEVELSGVAVAAREASLRLDGSRLRGTLSYTGAVGGERPRLFADVVCDALDLDTLPTLGGATAGLDDVDLDVALSARAIKVVPAGVGAVDAGEIALRVHKTGEDAVLDSFTAALGSSRLSATGRLDRGSATLDAQVDAPQFDALADLLGRLLPGSATAWLSARAPALSPARFDLGLRAARASDGALLPTGLVVDGVLDGSRVRASLDPDTPGDVDPATAPVTIDLAADAPQGLTMLRQLGLSAASGRGDAPSLGPGRLKARAHGSSAEGFLATIDASVGGTILSFQGRTKPGRGSGHLLVKGADVAPLLRANGLVTGEAPWSAEAEADLAWTGTTLDFRRMRGALGRVGFTGDLYAALAPRAPGEADKPALVGGLMLDRIDLPTVLGLVLGPSAPQARQATWSDAPFGMPLAQWPRAQVSVGAKRVGLRGGLEARDASFTIRSGQGAVTFADFTGALGAGRLDGALTLRRDGETAAASGTASWSGIDVDWPGLAGRTGGTLDFAGNGASPAALVASLAGTGSMTLSDGRIAGLDPDAVVRAARRTEASDLSAGSTPLLPDLDRAALPLGAVSGQAGMALGVVRVGPLRVVRDDWTADTAAAMDLKDMNFSSRTVLKVNKPLPDWIGEPAQVTLRLDGSIEAPIRDVDASALVNALQARAIARDQARIETFQQDVRERAFFNRRLKSIQADQAEAREKAKAESDAESAEAKIQSQMRQGLDLPRLIVPSTARPRRPSKTPGARSGSPPPGLPLQLTPNLPATGAP